MNSICDFFIHICILLAEKFQCFHICSSSVIETEKKHSIFAPVHVHIWKNASDTYSLRLSHAWFIKCDIAEKFNVNKSMRCQSVDFLFPYSGKWDMHFSWFSAFGLSRANSRKFFFVNRFHLKNNNACSWRAQTTHGSCHLEFAAKSERLDTTSNKW